MDDAVGSSDEWWEKFSKKYIMFDIADHVEILKGYSVKTDMPRSSMKTRNDIIKQIWLNFVYSLPPSLKYKAGSVYNNVIDHRKKLISKLCKCEKSEDFEDLTPRMRNIINGARNLAKINNHNDVAKVIHNLVMKERGGSLYAMIKAS